MSHGLRLLYDNGFKCIDTEISSMMHRYQFIELMKYKNFKDWCENTNLNWVVHQTFHSEYRIKNLKSKVKSNKWWEGGFIFALQFSKFFIRYNCIVIWQYCIEHYFVYCWIVHHILIVHPWLSNIRLWWFLMKEIPENYLASDAWYL